MTKDYYKDQIYKEAGFKGFGIQSAEKTMEAINKASKPLKTGFSDEKALNLINSKKVNKQAVKATKAIEKVQGPTTGVLPDGVTVVPQGTPINQKVTRQQKQVNVLKEKNKADKAEFSQQLKDIKRNSAKVGIAGTLGLGVGAGGLAYGSNEKRKNLNMGIQ